MQRIRQSKTPLWKKSMLDTLNLDSIRDYLYEISENGDMDGYDCGYEGYFNEYKEQFDELAGGAYELLNVLSDYDLSEKWDSMTVALLGDTHQVLGYDFIECDYFKMIVCDEDWAVQEAEKRLERFTKKELIQTFRTVMTTLVAFFDIKASHDCLTAVVEELDNRAAILNEKNRKINQLYQDLTGKNGEEFDRIIEQIPPRMWVE